MAIKIDSADQFGIWDLVTMPTSKVKLTVEPAIQ
jgi:hypothetical protein